MPTSLCNDEYPIQSQGGDRGKGELGRAELRAGATGRKSRKHQAQSGQCGYGGQRRPSPLSVENREVETHRADEQGDADDAVAGDTHAREEGAPSKPLV